MATTPGGISGVPSSPMVRQPSISEKYDRQLRLWGERGQAALENARIALLNAGPTGTETLKNLVLPGIGSFTIIDGHHVGPSDLGNNFFVTHEALGKPRAQVACQLLQELNETVQGTYIEEDPVLLADNKPDLYKAFTLIIATQMPEAALRKVAILCSENNIPLVVVRSYGEVGYVRIQVKEHTILELKPDNRPDDLRIFQPFEELRRFVDTFRLDEMDSHHASHVPYVVLLIKVLAQYRAEERRIGLDPQHDGKAPQTREEKNAFKALLNDVLERQKERLAQKMGDSDVGHAPEWQNFEEAAHFAFKAWTPYEIPVEVQALLNDDRCINLTSDASRFWIMAHALRRFVEREGGGCLPLDASISDMHADTESFVGLQQIFYKKGDDDRAAFEHYLAEALTRLGRQKDSISAHEIRLFCKNARFLRVKRCRSLEEEYTPETARGNILAQVLDDPSELCTPWYIALRAVDRFFSHHNRYPGTYDDDIDGDTALLHTFASSFLAELGLSKALKDDYIEEIVRYGASELHNIAAFLGGVASLEIIKIITGQFEPINNTFLCSGVHCCTRIWEL